MALTTTRTEFIAKLTSLASDPREQVASEAQRQLDHINNVLTESELTEAEKETRADAYIDRDDAQINVRGLNLAGDYLMSRWTELAP